MLLYRRKFSKWIHATPSSVQACKVNSYQNNIDRVETEVNGFTEKQPVILIYLTMTLYKQSHFHLIIGVKIARHLPITHKPFKCWKTHDCTCHWLHPIIFDATKQLKREVLIIMNWCGNKKHLQLKEQWVIHILN